jgi:hypothetical protein
MITLIPHPNNHMDKSHLKEAIEIGPNHHLARMHPLKMIALFASSIRLTQFWFHVDTLVFARDVRK